MLAHFNVTITADPKYGFWGMVILTNWQLIGYMMIIYIAGIQNIPTELIEAAEIDGANKFQTLYKIIIPMTMPSVTICLFLTLTNCFKLFDQNLALTAGGPAKKTCNAGIRYLYDILQQERLGRCRSGKSGYFLYYRSSNLTDTVILYKT